MQNCRNTDHNNADQSPFYQAASRNNIWVQPELGNLKAADQPNGSEKRIAQVIFHVFTSPATLQQFISYTDI
jgi:hypothetical protein